MHRRVMIGIAFAAMMDVSLSGCGEAVDRPKTAPVKGVVTYKGQPVDGASVMFFPTTSGRPATAQTNSQGEFTLTTFDTNDGAIIGEHRVTVAKIESVAPQGDPGRTPQATTTTPPKNQLPNKYNDPQQSGLKETVKAGEANSFKFDLAD